LLETVRSLKIEVQSYKEDNERLMREKSQINARVLQSLNQLQGQAKDGSRQEEGGRHHERRDDHGRVVIPEVLAELIDTTHLLTQQEIFMHLNIP
jgi:hypothetical protein